MASTTKQKWTSADVVALIRNKYTGQDYASFEQVADGTGAHGHSWIDVAAFGLWPSNGLHRLAFEVKVSRQDYLNEIRNQSKNAWAKECFHEFWYVTPGGVIKDESEVPEGCGWMLATRGGLRVKRQATIKKDAVMHESLFASLCRSAQSELILAKQSVRKDALAEDHGYQIARMWEEAAHKFLTMRKASSYPNDTVDEIVARFQDATIDAQALEDREHVLNELKHFQEKILSLSDHFSMVGLVSFLECDETGRTVSHHWRGEHETGLLAQREKARAKCSKRDRYKKEEAQSFVAQADRLLARAKALIEGDGDAQ